ncbi:cpw-wpc domain-containing protein [Toxoplasma gondii]|uniref:Cpw-wpc domain-containing protein n=1 Tax=Toxoplasma gondii TaxID=5811 RepID=A0A7J6JYK6_TOXGO|nr:cpw-wpc domain-containing protein [Toxoplasma gondii]
MTAPSISKQCNTKLLIASFTDEWILLDMGRFSEIVTGRLPGFYSHGPTGSRVYIHWQYGRAMVMLLQRVLLVFVTGRDHVLKASHTWLTKRLHLGDYACEASPEYKATGPCDSTWNFKHFTPAMKRKFEALCRARFPCQNSCPRDYSVGCPKGWKEIRGGVCEAPTDYTNCGIKTQFFLGMSPADKQVFEK